MISTYAQPSCNLSKLGPLGYCENYAHMNENQVAQGSDNASIPVLNDWPDVVTAPPVDLVALTNCGTETNAEGLEVGHKQPMMQQTVAAIAFEVVSFALIIHQPVCPVVKAVELLQWQLQL